jgi:hypothetical protein
LAGKEKPEEVNNVSEGKSAIGNKVDNRTVGKSGEVLYVK